MKLEVILNLILLEKLLAACMMALMLLKCRLCFRHYVVRGPEMTPYEGKSLLIAEVHMCLVVIGMPE